MNPEKYCPIDNSKLTEIGNTSNNSDATKNYSCSTCGAFYPLTQSLRHSAINYLVQLKEKLKNCQNEEKRRIENILNQGRKKGITQFF